MKQRRFAKGQRVVMGEREYVIEQSIPSGELQLRDVAINTYITKPENELVDLLFKGHLRLLNGESGETYAKKKMGALIEADLTELPDKLRIEARKKHNYVTGLVNMGVDRKTKKVFEPLIAAIAKSLGDENPPSYWQVYRWYTDYIASGESPRSFFPLHSLRGNRDRRIQEEVIEIINNSIAERYLNKQRLTAQAVFETVVVRIKHENDLRAAAGNPDRLKYPDNTTVYRIINKLDPYEVAKARYSKRYADMKFKPKKEGIRPTRPLERVEMDHTKLDLFVVDMERRMPIGRPWMTLAIDVFSKCIVGVYIGFEPPSYLTVMQCLLHAISPKTYVREKFPNIKHTWEAYGLMETIMVDNGKEFHSEDFEDACLQLGIVIQYAPVKTPWYKPSVERFFGTLNTGLLHQQPGTSFSNIFDKDEYDSKKNAVISYEAFEEMVHKWIIDVYHQDKHGSLMDIPAAVWRIGVQEFKPALPESRKELEIMLGMIETRKITASGIELNNLTYNDDNLLAIRRRYKDGMKTKAKVKYDPSDLSVIYVLDEFRKSYVPVRATSQSYTQGLNLWTHRVICRFARERCNLNYDIVSLALAKEEIWKIAENEWNLTKRTGTRQKMARFFGIGQDNSGRIIDNSPPEPYPAHLKENTEPTSEPVTPSAVQGPANGISDIGVVVACPAGQDIKIEVPVNENAGDGGFVRTIHPEKRRGRPIKQRPDKAAGSNKSNGTDMGIKVTHAIAKFPSLEGWGFSYLNEQGNGTSNG